MIFKTKIKKPKKSIHFSFRSRRLFTINYSLLTILCTIFTIHCSLFTAHAQDQHLVDSLQTILKTAKEDTTKANILNKLSQAYWGNDPDKAMDYANQTLAISGRISYKKGIGNAYSSMGVINDYQGDYLSALEFHKKALTIREEIGDKQGVAASYNNIGIIYDSQGNYPEALKNYFASLKIYEELGDKKGIAIAYNNIGIIYKEQGNYPEALKNYFACLKIDEELGDKKSIATAYNNIGVIYYNQGNYPEALKNYFASLKIREEIGDKNGIALSYNNIGSIYDEQGNYPEGLKNHFAALKIHEEIGDKNDIAYSYSNIGDNYTKQKKYNEASQYLNKALSLSKEVGNLENIKYSYESMATLDSVRGNFKQALEHYKLFIIYRDSLVNNENTKKTVQHQMQYDFDKKESETKAEQGKKDAIQRLTRNILIGGMLVVLMFAGVFFRQRNKISKEKKISEEERKRSDEEKKRSDDLLLNILPSEVATELKQTGQCQPKTFSMVTVLFADFKDFTSVSERVSAELLVGELNYCFSGFDNILQKHKIEKIKTVGDAYMCASGLPTLNYTHAFDVVTAALEMKHFILDRKKEKEGKGEIAFEIRIGIHTGPVVAGIVGIKKFSYDIWGDTVNLAARMESSCEPGQVNISGTTYELVKDKFNCTHRGKVEAKNKGEVDMYFVS